MSESDSSSIASVDSRTALLRHGVSADPIPRVDVVRESSALPGPGIQENDPDVVRDKHCNMCSTSGARNLVVCIDGTSNQFSTKNTNVVELYSRLVKDKQQRTFYNSGIGTYAKPSWKSWSYRKQVIANKLDLAFALRFEKIILSAYAWLVDNYEPGDRIFLFGFSRGAYQVRALAAMIDVVGLLYKGNNDQIPFAYELYAASDKEDKGPNPWMEAVRRISVVIASWVRSILPQGGSNSSPPRLQPDGTNRPPITMQDQFRRTFSQPNVHVHFVGAWDTVSSVGFIRDKTLPKTTDGMNCACFFRHALALHEFRVKFLPEYVNGTRGPGLEAPPVGAEPHAKEVWFSGSHSDIGGGSTANTTLDKFGPALRWMLHEAELAGLRTEEGNLKWDQGRVSKSMTLIWWIIECLPIKRLSYERWAPTLASFDVKYIPEDDLPTPSTTYLPHLSSHRQIQPGQLIFMSVKHQNVPFQLPNFAREEKDAYLTLVLRPLDQARHLGRIVDERNSAVLNALVSSDDGIESLKELDFMGYIHDTAQSCWNARAAPQILSDLIRLHHDYIKGIFRLERRMDLLHAVDTTESNSNETGTFPFHMCGHTGQVSSVTFLSETRVVSGSGDKRIQIWDTSTGKMTQGNPLSSHSGGIKCVAAHVATGRIASASYDLTIHLWTPDGNGTVTVNNGENLRRISTASFLAVAFSPDGSHLASGSMNGDLRVWDAATGAGLVEPVRGHKAAVRSIAFSSDGKRIVTSSDERRVRLWEWSSTQMTLLPCGKPLHGHKGAVSSVAFSPDGRVIASGSADKTVRLWSADTDTDTDKLTFKLEGHTNEVNSVAFSPSGKHVVSGSDDWTVRIWDASRGIAVRVLLGHTHSVFSVAFSPGGTRIASGSRDETVRAWDFLPNPDESPDHVPAAQVVSM